MLYDNLKDVIKHTFGLGFIDATKLVGENSETRVEAIAEDKSVVMYGKLKSEIADIDNETIGFARMAVLKGMLDFPPFGEDAATITIETQSRAGVEIPSEIAFKSTEGHKANYRFMGKEATNESIKVPPFKGATWDVVVEPTKKNLKDLSYFSSVLGAYEPVFTVVTSGSNLEFHIGAGGSDRSIVPVASDITGALSHQWSWPLSQVLAILKLSDASVCTMSFSDMGAMKINVDSGLGSYEYVLPARSK